ncbi:CPBP family intramembrane metalloprotease [Chryseobacterium sp. cx-311]|uniref:CPBP family intramembrane glutamic endopeptidase n=1 Tax=Marnyiella aurantia TaxID=2758037 RepID=UPI001AE34116|nr:type II CAAX endopeptidase family protein [Marnyiella aurantia]MBP0613498.1 CPBP family intramembrane metalloprotease [Marnyiella aurantia]
MPELTDKVEPHYTFGWRGAVVLIIGAMLPVILLNVGVFLAETVFGVHIQQNDLYLILSNAVLWMGAIWAFDYFECRAVTGRPLRFNLDPMNISTYALIFPLMFGMMLIAEFLSGQLPVTGPFFGPMYEVFTQLMEQMTQNTVTLVILAVIMAPVFEEVVFRGIIQKGLINKGMKPMTAIWISAVVFGIVHANPWQFVGAVLLGYVLGMVYHRTKSLLMPVLLHAFNNLLSVLLLTYSDTESFSEAFAVSEYLLLAVGILIFVLFHYLFAKKYSQALN